MGDKINCMGSLVQAVRILEEAKKDIENLYDNSQVRLPVEDVLFITDRLKEIHDLVKGIEVTNKRFELIANQNHEEKETSK